MNDEFPLVIPKKRTIKLGEGATLGQERITVEMQFQGVKDVSSFVQALIITDTEQQMELGNPPQVTVVDGKTDRPITEAQKKATVIFGTVLANEAMALVERELRRAIMSLKLIDTGTLMNLSIWSWYLIQKGQGAIRAPHDLPSFTQGDQLMLYPERVPHASWANWRAKAMSGKGFMAQATAAVRKLPVFRQFAVYAMFTSAHSVPGDTYPHGTPIIVIRPRIRRGG